MQAKNKTLQSLAMKPALALIALMILLLRSFILPPVSKNRGDCFSFISSGFFCGSPGFLAPSVSGIANDIGIAIAWRHNPNVNASQGSFFMIAAAIGGPMVKHAMLAAPRRKKVEALNLVSIRQPSDTLITHMLAVGVTSDRVTKIKAVATIPPPPKQARMDSSQMAFNGKT